MATPSSVLIKQFTKKVDEKKKEQKATKGTPFANKYEEEKANFTSRLTSGKPLVAEDSDNSKAASDSYVGKSVKLPDDVLGKIETKRAEKEAEEAKKKKTEYLESDEYKGKRDQYYQNAKPAFTGTSDMIQPVAPYQDETERELAAQADYAEKQAQAAKAEQVTNANLAEINAMPVEDRIALERYAVGTEVDRWESLNPAQNGFQIGRAQSQAADLIAKYGQEKVDQLAESWRWNYNAQQKREIEKSAQEAAGKDTGSAILHSAGSVAANLAGSIASPLDYLMQLGSRTGQYETLDPNSAGTIFNTYSSNVRGTVAQNIAGENNNPIRQALAYVYQGGMSAADNLARFALTGNPTLSLGLAATGSFGQTMSEASANGATPEQAVLMAVANGGLEILTEKIPLDELFKTWSGGKQTAKQIVMGAFKQAGLEATSEEINFLSQMVAEAVILGEKSSYNQQIGELVANGMSYEDAKQQVNNTVWKEAFDTAITSGISGGLSQVGAGLRANAREVGQLNTQQSEATEQTPAATPAASVQQPQETQIAPETQTEPQIQGNPAPQQVQQQPQAGQIQQDNPQGDSTVNLAEGIPTLQTEQRAKTEAEIQVGQAIAETLGANSAEAGGSVDFRAGSVYNQNTDLTGGTQNGQQAKQQPGAGQLYEADRAVASGGSDGQQAGSGIEGTVQGRSEGVPVSEVLRVNERLQQEFSRHGVSALTVADASGDAQGFTDKLTQARDADGENGWCVSPKTAQELQGVRLITDPTGGAGLGVTGDGDITAVFKNPNAQIRKAMNTMIPAALELGGNKLDCYGEGLVKLYSKYGFVPVARVAFNEAYANPGWDASKGTPDIYFMMHNGKSVADVIADFQNGTYQTYSREYLDNLPRWGKEGYDAAWDYRDGLLAKQGQTVTGAEVNGGVSGNPGHPQQEDNSRESTQEGQYQPGMQSQPSEDVKQSKTFTNTGLRNSSPEVRRGYREAVKDNPQSADYQVRHRADTLRTAQERVNSPERVNAEYDYLMGKDYWTADDVATSTLLQDRIMKSGEPDAAKKFAAISEKKKQIGSTIGQAADAFRIMEGTMEAASSPATAVDSFYNALDSMKEKETTFKRKKNGPDFDTWKKQVKEDVTRLGIAIEMVEDGDAGSMRNIIRQIAQQRKMTAWFGTSDRLSWNANRILNKLGFEDLKTIANTQVAAMADDYRARTKSDVIAGIRKQNMLTSIKTFFRNISGNTFGGLADSASDSLAGQMADYLISKFTGQRTVGNDFTHIKAYAKGAKDAGDFASLCVELGIPIETDAAGAYASATGADGGGKYIGRTFRANGNVAMRAMYAYQKYMSYSLEVSDKIFEGGTNAAVTESLQRLNGLSEQQISDLSEFAANRRTFKNATWTDEDGTIHGAVLARRTRKIKDAFGLFGDIALPFAEVPMNVAQTGIDYTTGVVKGIGEIASIIKDAKQGKPINAVRQRQAATDFGRGLTGVGMISLFAAAAIQGAIKVTNPDDWDEEALMQSEGRTGAQINWSALERGMRGESSEWKAGDVITSLDFLEPYNTQIYLGYELAQAEDIQEAFKQYPEATIRSVFNSLMDSPMMDGPEQILETIQEVADAETLQDKINVGASYAGDVASSFIPQVVRQAAQYTDGYYRDTRGATPVESAINSLKAAIPGLSQTLPMKYNGLGEPQKRGDFSSIFLDPTNTMEYQPNEVTTYLENLREQLPEDVGFIPDSQAPMSISVNGIERALDGKQRETYQKTYGEKVNEYYSSLIHNQDFSQLTPELQAEALKKAEQYATSFAKSAVSEYKEVPTENTAELTNNIVRDTVLNSITNIFTDLNVAEEYGYDQQEHEAALDAAYQQFKALSEDAQADARAEAEGNTSRYLEVRDNGVSQDAYLAASREVENVQGTGKVDKDTGEANVRDIDKREAVANTYGLTESQIDTIMHAYMPDYDPEAESKEYTEVKYDYIRQVLGLTPAEYAETYRAHLDNSKKADKIAEMMEMGFSRETATKLYKIYQGDATTKQQMLDWYGQ